MPGIVGFVRGRPVDPELLDSMIEPMLHRPTYRVKKHWEGNFAIATIDLPDNRQNDHFVSPEGRYHLTVYGMIYEDWADRNRALAEKLFKRFERSGWRGLAGLNGEYLIVVWDNKEARLTIVNDRLGLKRLQYWQGNGGFAFASELKALAVLPEVNRDTDICGLSELLTFGHLQDDRTLLKAVKLLPMANCFTWQDERIQSSAYWRYCYDGNPKFNNTTEAIDAFAHFLKAAVARRIERYGRVGLFLSGGLDSRVLGALAHKIRPDGKLMTWTAGHGHDHDTKYAKRIAAVIQSRHESVRIHENFLQDLAPFYAWALDGMVSAHGAHRCALMQAADGQCDAILCGYLGDTVGGDKRLATFASAKNYDELARIGFGCFPLGFTDNLFESTLKPEIYKQIKGFAFQQYEQTLKSASAELLADKGIIAEMIQRQRLWNPICRMDLMEMDAYTIVPFTDKEYVDFSLSLPFKQRCNKKVYQQMIMKHLPEVAGISRSGEGLPLAHSRLRASLHWRWVLFHRNVLPKLTFGKVQRHNYAAFVHCAEWFQNSSRRFIEETLLDNPILEEHFQKDALNKLVRSFLDGTAERDLMDAIASLVSYVLFRSRLADLPVFDPARKGALAIPKEEWSR